MSPKARDRNNISDLNEIKGYIRHFLDINKYDRHLR